MGLKKPMYIPFRTFVYLSGPSPFWAALLFDVFAPRATEQNGTTEHLALINEQYKH